MTAMFRSLFWNHEFMLLAAGRKRCMGIPIVFLEI
jgi:hypothetical protein